MQFYLRITKNKRFHLAILLVLLIFMSVLSYPSYLYVTVIQTNKNLESENQEINSQLLDLQSNISRLKAQYQTLSARYGTLTFNDTATINDLIDRCRALQIEIASANINNTVLQTHYQNLLNYYSNVSDTIQMLSQGGNFNYLIFDQGNGTYLAENGSTSKVDYSGTDGAKIIQKCIDSLNDSGGKIVLTGKISIETPLIINGSSTNGLLQLSGFGPSTQLMVGNNSDGIDVLGNQPYGYGGPYHIIIDDLVLSAASGQCMNVGIHITNWFNVNVENVMVFYADSSGVLIEDCANVNLNKVYVEGCGGLEYGGNVPLNGTGICLKGSKDCYLQQCYSDTNSIGFKIESNKKTNNPGKSIFLNQCEATLNEQKGVIISNCEVVSMTNCLIEGTNNDGLMIIDSSHLNVINTLIKGNAGNGVVLTSDSSSMIESAITIQSCTISDNNQNGIGIWAKNAHDIGQVNILSCTITNSGTSARGHPNNIGFWDGINISNDPLTGGKCSDIKILQCLIGNKVDSLQTQKYGIRTLQNTDLIQLSQNSFFANITGNFTLAGSHNMIFGNVG
jgi:hypothetical protein